MKLVSAVDLDADWTLGEAREVAELLGWWQVHRDPVVRKLALSGMGIRDISRRTTLAETTVGRIVRGR